MTIKTKPATNEYRENFDRIFTRNKSTDTDSPAYRLARQAERKIRDYKHLIDLKIQLAEYAINTGNFPEGSEQLVGKIMFIIDKINEQK